MRILSPSNTADISEALVHLESAIRSLHTLGYVGALSKVRGAYSELWVAQKLTALSPIIDRSDIWLESTGKKVEVKSNRRNDSMNGDAEYYWSITKNQFESGNHFDYMVALGYDDGADPLAKQKEFVFTYDELKAILRLRQDAIKENSHYGIGFFPAALANQGDTDYNPADLELSLHPERYSGKWEKILPIPEKTLSRI